MRKEKSFGHGAVTVAHDDGDAARPAYAANAVKVLAASHWHVRHDNGVDAGNVNATGKALRTDGDTRIRIRAKPLPVVGAVAAVDLA
jgi:hypothetical protein